MARLISSDQREELLISEDVVVTSRGRLNLNGMLWGNLTVRPGGKAVVDGIVKGTVQVDHGAVFELNGIVWGTIENFGAHTRIKGFVNELHEVEGARTDISQGYVRSGKR